MVVFLFDCWISQVFDEVQEVRYIAGIPRRDNAGDNPLGKARSDFPSRVH